MLQAVFADLRLYRHLIGIQIRSQLQYRLNLAFEIITHLGMTGLEFCALLLYFASFPSLLGWKVGEVCLLGAIMSLSFGLAEMVGAGVDAFPTMIRRGNFDGVLLRPAGAFLQVMGSDFRLRRLGRITQGGVAFVIALRLLPGVHWTVAKLIVLPLGIISGSILFIALFLLGATVCFWSIETTELTNMVTDGGRDMLTYPITIYDQVLQRVFLFVIPLAFGSYVPVCYILERSLPFGLPVELAFISPIIALFFACVAGLAWRFGVYHYQSTGS